VKSIEVKSYGVCIFATQAVLHLILPTYTFEPLPFLAFAPLHRVTGFSCLLSKIELQLQSDC